MAMDDNVVHGGDGDDGEQVKGRFGACGTELVRIEYGPPLSSKPAF